MFYISIGLTIIAFFGISYLIERMYYELESRIEKLEEKLNKEG